jgi:hypothetical protein
MFSGNTWWNREKTAQCFGLTATFADILVAEGFPVVKVCSRRGRGWRGT